MTIAPARARVDLPPTRPHRDLPAIQPRLDLPPAQLRRGLAEAPVGQHGLVEAALAWQRLRAPSGGWANEHGYLPIVWNTDQDVAARVARLLSGLAFCVVSQPDPTVSRFSVDVAGSRHRPVIRALTLVWRDTLRQFGPPTGPVRDPAVREAALALWRMASLVADGGPNPHLVTVGAGTPVTADLLVTAAARLGVRARIQRVRRLPAVVVDEPDQVRLLLASLLRTNNPG